MGKSNWRYATDNAQKLLASLVSNVIPYCFGSPTGAKHPNCVVDGLLESWEIALLLKWRSKGWAIKCPSEHGQGFVVVDILKLLDEVTQLHFGIGEGNPIHQAS